MSRARTVTSLALVVVLAAGAVAWVLLRKSGEREARIAGIVRDFDIERSRDELDRQALSRLVTRIRKAEEEIRSVRLDRVHAHILFLRGDLTAAWEEIRGHAMELEPTAEDLLLGARIQQALHARTGDDAQGRRALQLFERHYEASGGPSSLLAAWQCAHRLGARRESERLAAILHEEHAGTPQERLVALSERLVAGDDVSPDTVEELVFEFGDDVPLELGCLRVAVLLGESEGEDLEWLIDRAQELAQQAPAVVEARHYAATALFAWLQSHPEAADRGDRVRRLRAHLSWLMDHAPPGDERRDAWNRLYNMFGS